MKDSGISIIAGSSATKFVKNMCKHIKLPVQVESGFFGSLFLPSPAVLPVNTKLTKFSNGESNIEIQESTRNKDVFVIVSSGGNVNDDLVELLLILDSLKRSSCARVTVVLLNYFYARADRKGKPRVAISAKLVADLISVAGADRILTMELHSPQIAGFFNCPVDNLYPKSVFIEHIKKQHPNNSICVVAPDAGAIRRAKNYAGSLNCDVAMIYKHRKEANKVDEMILIGDVKDKNCILCDDMIDTAGTICKAAMILRENGASSVEAYAAHAVLSGDAVNRINSSELSKLYITDTIDNPNINLIHNVEVLSVAPLFAEAISGIHKEISLSYLFDQGI